MKAPSAARWFALLGAALALCLPPARATSVIAPGFADLVAKADCIVTADVAALRCERIGEGPTRRIVTFVTLDVRRVLKGEAPATLTLRTLGGTVDGETLAVADAPEFRVGERQILFVRGNGRQFIPLVGIMHGQYRVDGAGRVADHAGRPLARVEDIGAPETLESALRRRAAAANPAVQTPAALSREEFEARIITQVESLHANNP